MGKTLTTHIGPRNKNKKELKRVNKDPEKPPDPKACNTMTLHMEHMRVTMFRKPNIAVKTRKTSGL
jgi:hypothetical protein